MSELTQRLSDRIDDQADEIDNLQTRVKELEGIIEEYEETERFIDDRKELSLALYYSERKVKELKIENERLVNVMQIAVDKLKKGGG